MANPNAPIAPLAVSLGDPAGVGPEVLAAAWFGRRVHSLPAFCAIGGADLLKSAARLRGFDVPVEQIGSFAEAAEVFHRALPVFGEMDGAYQPGAPSLDGARLALDSLTEAARLAVSGEASALIVASGPADAQETCSLFFTAAIHAARERLVIGAGTDERRQEAVVDVDRASGPVLAQ